jgi:hypothetical protein
MAIPVQVNLAGLAGWKVAYEASDFGSGSAAAAVFRVSGDVARTGHPVQVPIRRQIEGNVRIMLQTTAATAP